MRLVLFSVISASLSLSRTLSPSTHFDSSASNCQPLFTLKHQHYWAERGESPANCVHSLSNWIFIAGVFIVPVKLPSANRASTVRARQPTIGRMKRTCAFARAHVDSFVVVVCLLLRRSSLRSRLSLARSHLHLRTQSTLAHSVHHSSYHCVHQNLSSYQLTTRNVHYYVNRHEKVIGHELDFRTAT